MEPKAGRAKTSPRLFPDTDDRVKVAADGGAIISLVGIMDDPEPVELKARNTFHGMGSEGSLIVVTTDESHGSGTLLKPLVEAFDELGRRSEG